MSELPANVVLLADRRRPVAEGPVEAPPAVRPRRHLRLVEGATPAFRLDVFLARGRAIMAEVDGEGRPGDVLPLHARGA